MDGYKIEKAMACFEAWRARVSEEPHGDSEDYAELCTRLSEAREDVEVLLTGVIRAAIEADSLAKMVKERLLDLQTRHSRYVARKESLRALAFAMLAAIGERTFKAIDFTVTVSDPRRIAVVTDQSKLEPRFLVVDYKPIMDKITTALKDGEVIEGADWGYSSPSLTIRTR